MRHDRAGDENLAPVSRTRLRSRNRRDEGTVSAGSRRLPATRATGATGQTPAPGAKVAAPSTGAPPLSDPTTSASPPPDLAEALARLDRLEATVADQDRVLDDLNGVVLDQWKLIEELKRRTAMLTDQLLEMESRSGLRGAPEPPPPHW